MREDKYDLGKIYGKLPIWKFIVAYPYLAVSNYMWRKGRARAEHVMQKERLKEKARIEVRENMRNNTIARPDDENN